MRSKRRSWLTALVAGMLLVAAAFAPSLHARMIWETGTLRDLRAAARGAASEAVAQEHGSEGHGSGAHGSGAHGSDEHVADASCFACLILAAPGLLARPAGAVPPARGSAPLGRTRLGRMVADDRVWSPKRARAPPPLS